MRTILGDNSALSQITKKSTGDHPHRPLPGRPPAHVLGARLEQLRLLDDVHQRGHPHQSLHKQAVPPHQGVLIKYTLKYVISLYQHNFMLFSHVSNCYNGWLISFSK